MTKRSLTILAAAGVLAAGAGAGAQAQDPEETGIRAAVQAYFDGVAKPDIESMQRAFHADAKMQSVKDGVLRQVTQPEWHERLRKNTSRVPANYRRIVAIDRNGDAASVKAESDFPAFQFVDYLSLLKLDGSWKIVAKIFQRVEKAKT
jgi:hypothetical protein